MKLTETVLEDPLLKAVLDQITDKVEREKTEKAIREMLSVLQTEAAELLKKGDRS